MVEKLNFYDLVGVLIPGVIMTAVLPLLFPKIVAFLPLSFFPEAFSVIILVGVAFFFGQVIQAFGSLAEPLLFWTWGGRPSESIISGKAISYLPKDSATRIDCALKKAIGRDAAKRSVFLYAIQLSLSVPSRSQRFQGLYAYHRSLLVTSLSMGALTAMSAKWGSFAGMGHVGLAVVFGSLLLLCFLLWHRTRQRAYYHAREVLLAAERSLNP